MATEGLGLIQLAALGAILAFLVISYLWWKVLGAFVRIALLALAFGAGFLLLRQMGALGMALGPLGHI